jgi:ubiquinone/menaquinone biosynthesis C-methylase UbiE
MSETKESYIPPLQYRWLTPAYDFLLRMVLRDEVFKRQLVVQAQIGPSQQVLDLGCGTGTLTVMVKQIHPGSDVTGLDADRAALAIAKRKAAKAGVEIGLDQGMSYKLPYPDASFDRALSSLFFHHLKRQDKQRTLEEVHRILKPGGELHVADFGKPHNRPMGLISLVVKHFEETADNFAGLLPELFRRAGFQGVRARAPRMTPFGTLWLYRARKPR